MDTSSERFCVCLFCAHCALCGVVSKRTVLYLGEIVAENASVGGQRYRRRVCFASFFFSLSPCRDMLAKWKQMLFVAIPKEWRQKKKEEKTRGNKERERERDAENRFTVPDNSVPQRLTSQLAVFSSREHLHAAGTCFKSQSFDTH